MKGIGLKRIRLSVCLFYYIPQIERNSSDGVRRSRNVNSHMKAKCPFCTAGCSKCENSGKINVRFAEGNLWTRVCLDEACGFENGGRIEKGDKEPPEPSGPCVMCKGPTKWLLIGCFDDTRTKVQDDTTGQK